MNSKFRYRWPAIACAALSFLPLFAQNAKAQGVSCASTYTFGGTNDGGASTSPLFIGNDGTFYGATSGGGSHALGTVFQMDTGGNLTTLHSFAGSTNNDGAIPAAGVVQSGAYFYGVTATGGANNLGTVFKVSAFGTYQLLYSFAGTNDGANPRAAMVIGPDGNLYGTTQSGGPNGLGTVFKLTSGGVFTSLYSFSGTTNDGSVPETAMVLGTDGSLYGTTFYGGASNAGVVFKLTTNGNVSTFYSFTGGNDGRNPAAPLILGTDGNFYGTTYYGGSSQSGNLFKLTGGAVITTLYSFTGGNDGSRPKAGLLQAGTNFYGTTFAGGANGGGVVFRYNATAGFTNLYAFTGGAEGYQSDSALVQASDGNFYGTTSKGDPQHRSGAVFKVFVHPQFFNGEVALGGGVYYLAFPNNTVFGYYNYGSFPYFYHYDLGFSYYFDGNDAAHSAYLYDFVSSHFWYTTPAQFPNIYDFSLNSWLYYYPDTANPGHYLTNPRLFYNYTTRRMFNQ